MKKILMILLFGVTACSTVGEHGNKPVSGQIPSTKKAVLNGTSLKTVTRAGGEFNALERLFDTVWFQTETDEDDGVVETETEFLFFKNIDDIVQLEEKEMENGVIEEPSNDNEYSTLTEMDDTVDPIKLNAFVAKNTEFENGIADEAEYEGYWLKDSKTLYVIDGDIKTDVIAELKAMLKMTDAEIATKYDEDNKYILSEKAEITDVNPTTPAK